MPNCLNLNNLFNEMNEEQIWENKYDLTEQVKLFIAAKSVHRKKAGYADSTEYFLISTDDVLPNSFVMVRISDHNFNIQHLELGKDVIWKNASKNTEEVCLDVLGMISIQIHDGHISPTEAYYNHLFNKWKTDNPAIVRKISYDMSKCSDIRSIEIEKDFNNTLTLIKKAISSIKW